ncbi:phosphodiesterase, partial [Paeniclostridium sordellii]|uniref:metallophosphoesterase n=1 Tax=Paraclostridium sordellii TaxID=1505 RepID=UPI00139C4293
MKIGVMSDTHGSLPYFEKALDTLSDCDILLHAGDVLYHGPRNDLPKGYDPKGVISKINNLDNILIAISNINNLDNILIA